MADFYAESSSWLDIPADKIDAARAIVKRVMNEIGMEDEPFGYVGCEATVLQRMDEPNKWSAGVWIHGKDCFNAEHAERIARELVEKLDLEGTFCCSWANLCSKPRLDSFGGGAFVLAKGIETYWVCARSAAERYYSELMANKETANERS
jgi:hypothetical protein